LKKERLKLGAGSIQIKNHENRFLIDEKAGLGG
jgi:hypothetical protein